MMTPANLSLKDEVQISYFVKAKKKKSSRICAAELIDISNVGLCMEISPTGSELYMESGGKLFLINKKVEIQIFCRSHSNNISVEAQVKWIKQNSESSKPSDEARIYVGVLFSSTDANQKRELAELIQLIRKDTVRCGECSTPVSADASLCYKCGARLVRKRTFLRSIINSVLSGTKKNDK
jgi:hypothetical protein